MERNYDVHLVLLRGRSMFLVGIPSRNYKWKKEEHAKVRNYIFQVRLYAFLVTKIKTLTINNYCTIKVAQLAKSKIEISFIIGFVVGLLIRKVDKAPN